MRCFPYEQIDNNIGYNKEHTIYLAFIPSFVTLFAPRFNIPSPYYFQKYELTDISCLQPIYSCINFILPQYFVRIGIIKESLFASHLGYSIIGIFNILCRLLLLMNTQSLIKFELYQDTILFQISCNFCGFIIFVMVKIFFLFLNWFYTSSVTRLVFLLRYVSIFINFLLCYGTIILVYSLYLFYYLFNKI